MHRRNSLRIITLFITAVLGTGCGGSEGKTTEAKISGVFKSAGVKEKKDKFKEKLKGISRKSNSSLSEAEIGKNVEEFLF